MNRQQKTTVIKNMIRHKYGSISKMAKELGFNRQAVFGALRSWEEGRNVRYSVKKKYFVKPLGEQVFDYIIDDEREMYRKALTKG